MKRFLTIIAIFMTMLCGSVLLVSCSKGYDKMYLEVEYAVPTADGEDVKWNKVSAGSNFDYFLSDEVYSQSDMSHILWLRIKVKGTSKKVNSLYISQSANNSTFLEKTTVKPGEAFKVKVENIGSVRFTVTPSQGGESKVMSFGVNIYKELTGISQNADCVPAVVTGGFIMLENLTNLIQYAPIGETNQTGVNFSIEGVGTLIDDGTDNLINRTFRNNANYEVQGDALVSIFDNETALISFDRQSNLLMLNISTDYKLTNQNNVIKLKATSKYHEDITTDVYVYIVENFKADSLLVSYSKDITLTDGKLPDDITVSQPIGDDIVIYNSSVADLSTDIEFNAIEMYTYTNASIYSYESSPGMQLNVFINGVRYDYNDVVNDAFGVQVSPIINSGSGVDKLVGLKFEVNPNSSSTTNVYNVRLELDFTAFNFGVSGEKSPVSVLNKEFTITVENLASGFHINGKGYGENLQSVLNGATSTITAYGSTQAAKLYTTYSSSALGMPLNIQATPTNAINTKVYVGFYENITDGTELGTSIINKVQLLQPSGTSVPIVNNQFEIDFAKKDRVIYLAFNETENIQNLKQIYMVCRVVATPDSFREQIIAPEYVTFVACIDVVGAVQDIGVYKNIDNGELLDDEYLATSTIDKPYNVAYIKFNSNSLDVDYSEIEILSLRENIKYSADGSIWTNNVTADMLTFVQGKSGMYKKLYFKVEKQCTDTIIINSPNGVANQIEYKFVNVTSGMEEVEVTYEDTYMWTSNIADTVGIKNVTDGEIVSLKYLALQSGRTTQFKASGDGKTNTIKSVEAKSLYNTSIEYNSIIKGGNSLYNSTISTFSATAISVKTYNNIDGTSSY
ncbi:MAG: hypothetical protein IJ371_03800, partial [Clostridia bacterium]|nr:hypothetical protein [Clostridia bacterium]